MNPNVDSGSDRLARMTLGAAVHAVVLIFKPQHQQQESQSHLLVFWYPVKASDPFYAAEASGICQYFYF